VASNNCVAVASVTALLAAMSACAQTATAPKLRETITEGRQFAHYLQFPSGFNIGKPTFTGVLPIHYGFRTAPAAPNLLFVSACEYKDLDEICSATSFAIDTAHGYAVRPATVNEWQSAKPIEGAAEMDDPFHRTLRKELAQPAALRTIPIDDSGPAHQRIGYLYIGKKYLRRGEWVTTALHFGHSADQRLIILTGADDRAYAFPKNPQRAESNVYGRFSVDIYDSSPDHRIAALDIDCVISVIASLSHVSLINSRWVAIGLDPQLQKMLLFDFEGAVEKRTK
jgi:hypothetical protein